MRAAVAAREGRRALLQNMTGLMSLYIDWADAMLDITASKFRAFAEVKIAMSGRKFFVDSAFCGNNYREIPHSI